MPAQSFQAQGSSSGAGAGPAASHPADAQMHEDDGAHSDSSSFDEEDDQDYGDWVDDEEEQAENRQSGAAGSSGRFLALFPEESFASSSSDSGLAGFKRFTSAEEALADAKKKGCDLVSLVGRLGEWPDRFSCDQVSALKRAGKLTLSLPLPTHAACSAISSPGPATDHPAAEPPAEIPRPALCAVARSDQGRREVLERRRGARPGQGRRERRTAP